jgi:salicylate hydroxylase
MAVEDAAALSKALSYVTDKDNLSPALKLVEDIRVSRTKRVQEASLVNGNVLHLCDGPLQEARDAAMRPSVEGRPLDKSPYGISDLKTQAWCYGYDVMQDVEETWARSLALAQE